MSNLSHSLTIFGIVGIGAAVMALFLAESGIDHWPVFLGHNMVLWGATVFCYGLQRGAKHRRAKSTSGGLSFGETTPLESDFAKVGSLVMFIGVANLIWAILFEGGGPDTFGPPLMLLVGTLWLAHADAAPNILVRAILLLGGVAIIVLGLAAIHMELFVSSPPGSAFYSLVIPYLLIILCVSLALPLAMRRGDSVKEAIHPDPHAYRYRLRLRPGDSDPG